MPSPPLTGSQIQIWRVDISPHGKSIREYASLLSAEERMRAEQFRLAKDRCRNIVGRGALRWLLAGYTGIAPASLDLRATPQGKPFLSSAPPRSIYFNVSHSGDIVICGFSAATEIGVDVEQVREHTDYQRIAARFFSEEENKRLFALPEAERIKTFHEIWVCKEAVIKALGGGLSVPLDSFSICFDSEKGRIRVKFEDETVRPPISLYLFYAAEYYPAAAAFLSGAPLVFETFSLSVPPENAFDTLCRDV